MSVTYPLGFRAGGIQAGLRTTPGLDLALIVNDGPADVVAGVARHVLPSAITGEGSRSDDSKRDSATGRAVQSRP